MSKNLSEKNHHSELGHILPLKVYISVLVTLLLLTILTVVASHFDFGAWNLVIAMAIASAKALTVALFFMHLKYENPLTWLYAAFPIFLLFVLLGGLYLDNPLR